jgi:hypothetical protein
MKKIILIEIYKRLKANPRLLQKAKTFAALGILAFLLLSGLLIWAGVSTVSYMASSAKDFVQSPETQAQAENIRTELKTLPKLQTVSCMAKAKSLFAVQPWLERPTVDNLLNLKVACFEQTPKICHGAECEQMKQLINTADRSEI